MAQSRGIVNNNPGNIKKSGDKWQGLADIQSDSSFFEFKSADWGIRAMAVLLIGYYDRENLNTINLIVSHYAPPSDGNDTVAYIKDVSADTPFTPNQPLNLHEYKYIFPLVKAMIKHEQGQQLYTDEMINTGLARAGIEIPKKPFYATTVVKGAAIAIIGQASDAGTTLLSNTPSLAQYAGNTGFLHHLCAGLTVAGIGLSFIGHIFDRKKSINGGGA